MAEAGHIETKPENAVKQARIFAGIDGLCELIETGIPQGASVILQTPSGPERDLFMMGFIKEGLQSDGAVIISLSMNSPDEFKNTHLANFGISREKVAEYEEKGKIKILDWYSFKNERIQGIEEVGSVIKCSKALTNVEIALNKVLRSVEGPCSRAMIDVLSPALKVFDFETVYKFAQTIRAKFKKEGVTSLFVVDREMHDQRTLSSLHRVFDGVIDIERERVGNKLESRLGILAMSGAFFLQEYRTIKTSKEGMKLIAPVAEEKKAEMNVSETRETDDTTQPMRAREMRRQIADEKEEYMEVDIGLDAGSLGVRKDDDDDEMLKALSIFSSVLNPKVNKEYSGEAEELDALKAQIAAYKAKGLDVSFLNNSLTLDPKLRQRAFDDFADYAKKAEALEVELDELQRSGRISDEPYKSDVVSIRASLKFFDKFAETQDKLAKLNKSLEEKVHASQEEKKKALEAYAAQMESWRKEGYNVSVLEKVMKTDYDTIAASFARFEKFLAVSRELNDKLAKMDTTGVRVNAAMIKSKLKDYEKIGEVVKDFAELINKAKSLKEKKEGRQ